MLGKISGVTAAILILARPLTVCAAAGASGIVLDPQDMPVAHLTVALTCGASAQSITTDGRGRFVFASRPESADCWIDIVLRGFVPIHERIASDAAGVRIQLRLADVKETVTVTAPSNAPIRSSLTSVDLGGTELRNFSGNTADLIRYTRLLAGAATTPSAIYVDGLPGGILPPIDMIAGISVNGDPFSAEYSDGDVTTIRIITRAPARTFRLTSGTDVLGFGGHNVIGPAGQADATFGNLGVRGAIPGLPITFTAGLSRGRTSNDVPIEAVLPPSSAHADASVASVNRNGSGSLELFFAPSPTLKANISYREASGDGVNVGAGAQVLPEAAFASTFGSRDLRATVTNLGERVSYEGGVVLSTTASSTRANADDLGVVIVGNAIMGGAAMTASGSDRTRWTVKQVLRSTAARPWAVGVSASGVVDRDRRTPNPHGVFQVDGLDSYEQALMNRPTGTWFTTRGSVDARYANVTLSPFVQRTLVRAANLEVDGGLRADYHSDLGTLVSPRVSFGARAGGFVFSGGAGLFVRAVSDAVFLRAIENDGVHLQEYMATGVSLSDTATAVGMPVSGIRSVLAGNLARPREMMEKIAVERRVGNLTPGLEATWTQDRHLLGSERLPAGADWIDLVESNRAADRIRVHAQVRYVRNRQTLAAHYEWTRAYDDTDGPFSFPAQTGNLGAEWGRSAGVAPHTVTVAGSFALPKGVSLSVTDSWTGSAPYNVTTGLDALGNGLFIDRGGLLRNSGDGPSSHSLSLYGYRRLALPEALAHGRVHLNLGVQADNILDNKNYLSIGSVLSSPSFGRPLAAMPGRSVRMFLNVN